MELWNWRNRSARTMVEGETPPEAPPDPMLPAQGGMEVGRMPDRSGRPLTAPPQMTQSFMSPIGSMVSTGIQPKRPIMGDLIQITRDEWGVLTGGKPSPSWTGRDEKDPPSFTCPNQLRPIKIVEFCWHNLEPHHGWITCTSKCNNQQWHLRSFKQG